MIYWGSKCCCGNRAWCHCRAGLNPWSFFPFLSFMSPPSLLRCNPTISGGQESGYFKSHKWLMEMYFTDHCKGARGRLQSDMISHQSGEKVCHACLEISGDGEGGKEREREWVWEGCFALSYYITHGAEDYKSMKEPSTSKPSLTSLCLPLHVAVFLLYLYICVSVWLSCSTSLANYHSLCICNALSSARLHSFYFLF